MRVLITGGAGFIGSHLTDRLLAAGHRIVVLDDLSTGSRRNLAHHEASDACHVVEGSVLDSALVDRLVAEVDVTVHLAAAVGVRLILERPLSSIRTNLRGTENVLEAAARHGQRVLLASTSEVYGKNEQLPLREDADEIIGSPYVARWLYANTKAANEFTAMAYWWEQRLPITIVRLFNTVGPRQTGRYGMVVPSFVRQALAGESLTVYGDGRQSRCFTAVGDAVRALVALLDAPGTLGELFNIGGTQPTTILDLAQAVIARTGSASPLRFVPYEEAYGGGFAEMRARQPDTTKLRRAIGFAPDTPLPDILDQVIAFERANVAREAHA